MVFASFKVLLRRLHTASFFELIQVADFFDTTSSCQNVDFQEAASQPLALRPLIAKNLQDSLWQGSYVMK